MRKMRREEAERRILAFVADYLDQYGYSPSYAEIAAAVGYDAPSSVQRHIKRMEAEGRLTCNANAERGIKLHRQIALRDVSGETEHRVCLEVADCGIVRFDCTVTNDAENGVQISFGGVYDATGTKGKLGRVVGCSIE